MSLADRYLQKVLIANGIGDIVLGLVLLVASEQMAGWLAFYSSSEVIYLSGGWGIAAITFGLLRFFAGLRKNTQLQWFIANFGVFEGTLLTLYGIFLVVSMELTFFQVSLSTIFASTFLAAYVLAFLLRSRQRHF